MPCARAAASPWSEFMSPDTSATSPRFDQMLRWRCTLGDPSIELDLSLAGLEDTHVEALQPELDAAFDIADGLKIFRKFGTVGGAKIFLEPQYFVADGVKYARVLLVACLARFRVVGVGVAKETFKDRAWVVSDRDRCCGRTPRQRVDV